VNKKKILASVSSNIGAFRKINQDNFYLNGVMLQSNTEPHFTCSRGFSNGVFAVADGMGGESYGEFASMVTMVTLGECCKAKKLNGSEGVKSFVDMANSQICQKMLETNSKIGTTVALAIVKRNKVRVYNVGDSRCMLYRKGQLIQLSKDHTVVAHLVECNLLTPEQAKTDKRRHQLSQHVGIFPEDMEISIYESPEFSLQNDDIILICTDGVTDSLDENTIIKLIKKNPRMQQLTNDLVYRAIENGSKDNATAIAIQCCKDTKDFLKRVIWILGGLCAVVCGVLSGLLTLQFLL